MSVTGKTFQLSQQKFNEYLGRNNTFDAVFVNYNPRNLPFKVLSCDEEGNILAIEIPGGKILRADEDELSAYWCVFLDTAYTADFPGCHLTEVKPAAAPEVDTNKHYVLTEHNGNKTILGPLAEKEAYDFAKRQVLNAVPEVVVKVLKVESIASVVVKFD